MKLATDAIGQHDHGRDDAAADRRDAAGLVVRFAGHGRGYFVAQTVEPGAVKVVGGPFTTREAATARADELAAA